MDGVPIKLTSRLEDMREKKRQELLKALSPELSDKEKDAKRVLDAPDDEALEALLKEPGIKVLSKEEAKVIYDTTQKASVTSMPKVESSAGVAATLGSAFGSIDDLKTKEQKPVNGIKPPPPKEHEAKPLIYPSKPKVSLLALRQNRNSAPDTTGMQELLGKAMGEQVKATQQSVKDLAPAVLSMSPIKKIAEVFAAPVRDTDALMKAVEDLVASFPAIDATADLIKQVLPDALEQISNVLLPKLDEVKQEIKTMLEFIPDDIQGAVLRAGQDFLEGLSDQDALGGLLFLTKDQSELLGPQIPSDKLGDLGTLMGGSLGDIAQSGLGQLASQAATGGLGSTVGGLAAQQVAAKVAPSPAPTSSVSALGTALGEAASAATQPSSDNSVPSSDNSTPSADNSTPTDTSASAAFGDLLGNAASSSLSPIEGVSGVAGLLGGQTISGLTRGLRNRVQANEDGAGLETPWGGMSFGLEGGIAIAQKLAMSLADGTAGLDLNSVVGAALSAIKDGKVAAQFAAKDDEAQMAAVDANGNPTHAIAVKPDGIHLKSNGNDVIVSDLLDRIALLESRLAALETPTPPTE